MARHRPSALQIPHILSTQMVNLLPESNKYPGKNEIEKKWNHKNIFTSRYKWRKFEGRKKSNLPGYLLNTQLHLK